MIGHRLGRATVAVAVASVVAGCGHAAERTVGDVAPNGVGASPASSTIPTPPMSPIDNRPEPSGASAGASAAQQYASAVGVLEQRGFVLADGINSGGWHPERQLNALVGILANSGDGGYQRVFFFVDGRYIGNDTPDPSINLQVLSTRKDMVTVTYGLFRESDPVCCPGGGSTKVRFQWNGQNLVALDPIPPADHARLMRR